MGEIVWFFIQGRGFRGFCAKAIRIEEDGWHSILARVTLLVMAVGSIVV